jgi:hydrophobe/amphiphile efflux-3 (HAE3) family protein
MRVIWRSVGRAITGRAKAVTAAVAVLTLVLGYGMTRLEFETSQASLVSSDSDVFQVSERYQDAFGGQPMYVLLTGPVEELFAPENLDELRAMEEELRASGRFDAVIGPLTALEFAADQLTVLPAMLTGASDRAQAAAPDETTRAAVEERYATLLMTEMSRLSAAGEASLDNPAFVEFLLRNPDGSIRAALADNFLDDEHALMAVRLPGNASIAEEGALGEEVRAIVESHPLEGFEVLATGPPVLLKEINDYLRGGMATLGALAVVVMLAVLWFVFRARWRLLSLAVVALGLVWAFGAVGYAGVPLSMVTISGLPILLGLGVDFAIQTHNRFEEEARSGHGTTGAVDAVMTHMAPPLTLAMIAAVAGFLALQLSEVPMIKDFGLLLAIGMVVLVVEAIVVVTALLTWLERAHPRPRSSRVGAVDRVARAATTLAPRYAAALAVAGLALGIVGLAAEGGTPIQTDPEAWLGEDSAAVTELTALREGTGYSAELGFDIEADDPTSTEVVTWIDEFARRQLDRHPEALVHATGLPTIISSVTGVAPVGEDIDQLLTVAPVDVESSFLSEDGRRANLIFPIANLSLQEREDLLDAMTADVDPPEGVSVEPAGLVVLGIELVNDLEAGRQLLTLAALTLVAAWLLVAYRHPVTALLPLVPVVMAVGASALVIRALGLELTPLTTVSGPLAIAITTEFSVLLLARFLEERRRGATPDEACTCAAERIGRAFLASGLTLLGGFVVLAFSPMPLLVDFGVVVAIDVALALVSVLVVLPPLLRGAARFIPIGAATPVLDLREPPVPIESPDPEVKVP